MSMENSNRRLLVIAVAAVFWGVVCQCYGAEIVWTNNSGNGDGSWSTTTNWHLGRLPEAGDAVVFKPDYSYDCNAAAGDVPQNLASVTAQPGYSGTITFAANFAEGPAQTLTVSGSVTLNGGTLVLSGLETGDTTGEGVTINAAHFTLGENAKVHSNGRGFSATRGPGGGGAGEAGAHGGQGGGNADPLYGSATVPVTLGSGGADTAGGGALKINVAVGTITIDGAVSCNGQMGNWMSGWSWRKRHVIAGSAGAGANYQVKLDVHRSSGVDSGEGVYLRAKCLADFGDVRFTAADGVTLLDYWLESVKGNDAVFWVEVADDLGSDQAIYIYYGKAGAATTSNGDDTFILFDDFSAQNNDKFTYASTSMDFSVSGGTLSIWSDGSWASMYSIQTFADGEKFAARTRYKTTGINWWFQNCLDDTSSGEQCFRICDDNKDPHGFHIQYNDGTPGGDSGDKDLDTIVLEDSNIWYINENRKTATTTFEAVFWSDAGSLLGSQQLTQPGFAGRSWTWRAGLYKPAVCMYDWIAFRKCLAAEPSPDRWSAEEAEFGGTDYDTGAGGSIYFICGTLAGGGLIEAVGGTAMSNGQGGAGGRIAASYATCTFVGITDVSGGPGGLGTGEAGSVTPGNLDLADHAQTQAPNAFGGADPLMLYRFRLQTDTNSGGAFESIEVTRLIFDLSDICYVDAGDITSVKVYADANFDGSVDGGDVEMTASTVDVVIAGAAGTITMDFAGGAFVVDGTVQRRDFMLQADVASVEAGDKLAIDLAAADTNIIAAGEITGTTAVTDNAANAVGFAELAGSSTGVTHEIAPVTNAWLSTGIFPCDGDWSNADNWSLGHAPLLGEAVVFDDTSTEDCTAAAGAVAQEMASLTVTSDYTGTITFEMNFAEGPSQTLAVKRDVILNGGTLILTGRAIDAVTGEGVTINAGDITVGAAAVVHCDGTGFAAGQGPGAGGTDKGGAHGGRGGGPNTALYGAATAPVTLGSGGEDSAGGGAIKLNASGTLTVDGTIRADGAPASPGWFSGWLYRKRHTVTGADGAGTGYQVKLIVHRGAGADAGEDVYLNGKCRTDFGDVRFADAGGVAELDYWMEEMVDSDYAVFWIEVTADLGSDRDIHVCYGKGDAATTSDGSATFSFFDDFETDTSGDYTWTTVDTKSPANSHYWNESEELLEVISGDNDRESAYRSVALPSSGSATIVMTKMKDYPSDNQQDLYLRQDADNYYRFCFQGSGYSAQGVYKVVAAATTDSSTEAGTVNTDGQQYTIVTYWTPDNLKLDIDGSTRKDIATVDTTALVPASFEFDTFQLDFDWELIYIRKYVAAEPAHGAWVAEETEPAADNDSGAGGSIYLTCDALAGSGTVRAAGGSGASAANGGGGGRVCMSYGTSTFTGTASAPGGAGGAAGGEAGSVAPCNLRVTDHTAAQVTDAFAGAGDYDDAVLFRFNLGTDGNTDDKAFENMEITGLEFDLSSVTGISAGEITDIKLYRDKDGSGTVNGGDVLVAVSGSPVVDITATDGTITFEFDPDALLLDDTAAQDDFLLVMDVSSIAAGDRLTLDLNAADAKIVAAGKSLAETVNTANAVGAVGFAELSGATTGVQHSVPGTFIWTNNDSAGDGNWSTPSNWDLDAVPIAGDAVVFSAAYDYDCNAPAGSVAQNLASLTMQAGYTSTVAFADYFAEGSLQELTVTGTVAIQGGTLALGTISYAGKPVPADPITINAASFTVDAGAMVDARYRGYPYHSGPGARGTYYGGGAHGGRGGANNKVGYGSKKSPETPGSGGDNPAYGGGGTVKINVGAGTITVDGTIISDGLSDIGSWSSDAGTSGGSIYLIADTVTGTGTLQANGGDGTCGAGGGGRIAAECTTFTFAGKCSVAGGDSINCDSYDGRPGSVYLPSDIDLIVKNGDVVSLAAGGYTFGDVTVQSGGTLFCHSGYDGFGDTDVDTDTESIALSVCGILETGDPVYFTGTDLPDPLVADTDYYVYKLSDNVYTIHTNATDASTGANPVDLADVGSGTRRVIVGCRITASNLMVESGGLLYADSDGFMAESGPGSHTDNSTGPSHGGYGMYGNGGTHNYVSMVPYGDPDAPVTLGSGGRAGSYNTEGGYQWGGGAVKIDVGAGTVTVDGIVRSNGDHHYYYIGGTGGSVWITCGNFAGAGLVQANGGDTDGPGYGQPSGGRVAVAWSVGTTYTGDFDVRGGRYGDVWEGQPGTLSLPDGADLTVRADRKVGLAPGSHTLGDVTVQSEGVLFFHGESASGTGCELTATSVTVESDGEISAYASGYATGAGDGASTSGASHGGRGAGAVAAYGDVTAPVTLGSGGKAGSNGSYYGGGAIRINVPGGAVTIDGTVSANGYGTAAGGAGGSVYVVCGALSGSGTIEANGGTAGGGGRIALDYITCTFTGTTGAAGNEVGSVLPGSLSLDEHTAAQAGNAFAGAGDHDDIQVYRFKLQSGTNTDDGAFEEIEISQLVFDLTEVDGIIDTQFADVHLYQDDGDGVVDAEIANIGWTVSDLSGGTGTLTMDFGAGVLVLDDDRMTSQNTTYPDFILQTDVTGVVLGDRMKVRLNAVDSRVTATGTTLGEAVTTANDGIGFAALTGTVTAVTHDSDAGTNVWSSAGDTNWNVDGNWSLGWAPKTGEAVVFDATSSVACNAAADTVAQNLASITVASTYGGTITFDANFGYNGAGGTQALAVKRSVTINGGTLVVTGDAGADTGVTFTCAGTGSTPFFTVGSGGILHSNALGYGAGVGTGGGAAGEGGSHAGRGGGVVADKTYGSATAPVTLGSGGQQGAGGGAVRISVPTGTVTVSGTLSVNGETNGNSGAGGSIYIECDTLAGDGLLEAKGGGGGGGASGGAGGRIALSYSSCSFTGSTDISGGAGTGSDGEAGSVVPGSLRIAEHTLTQLSDAFAAEGGYNDTILYLFKLRTDGSTDDEAFESMDVTKLVFDLGAVSGVAAGEITDLKLYRDKDGSGTVTGGDLLVIPKGGFPTVSIDGDTGNITYEFDPGDLLLDDTAGSDDFFLMADVASVATGDRLAIGLNSLDSRITGTGGSLGKIASASNSSGFAELSGTVEGVTHVVETGGPLVWTNGSGNGDWSDPGNWNIGRVPQAGDDVTFDSTSTGNCTAGAGAVPQNLASLTIASGYGGTITFGSNFAEGPSQTLAVTGGVTLNDGTLILSSREIDDTTGEGATINAANFVVGSNAILHADGRGFSATKGPGAGAVGEGGAHGGEGANNADATYGSGTVPVTLGSGGADTAGGGAIKLNATGAITVDGMVRSNGGSGVDWWYDSDWTCRKKIVIDSAKVDDDLTNFPALVHLASDAGLAADAQADGDDILFTSSDGTTKLSHEIREYVSGTGELAAWVLVPGLSASADTEIYMYYGNAGSSDQRDAAGVWAVDFGGVWHFEESPPPTAGDTTANNNNGAVSGDMSSDDRVAGKVGWAWDFDGADDYADVPDSGTLESMAQLTVSAWVRPDVLLQYLCFPMIKEGAYRLNISPDGAAHFVVRTSNNGWYTAGTRANADAGSISAGTWYHLAGVYDGQYVKFYIDGELIDTGTQAVSGTIYNNGDSLRFAHKLATSGGSFYSWFDGQLDELRVASAGRSAGWVKTEYSNQSSPLTFVSTGPEETFSSGSGTGDDLDTGAGGSLLLVCSSLAGSGRIESQGGTTAANGNAGGGGRIAIDCTTSTFTGTTDATGGTGGLGNGEAGSVAPGSLDLADHVQTQAPNAFGGANPLMLYRFRLQTDTNSGGAFESMEVTRLIFDLSDVYYVDAVDITNVKVYADANFDGSVDGGDVEMVSSAVDVSIAGDTGAVTIDFAAGDFVVDGTAQRQDFILRADVASVEAGDELTIDLAATDTKVITAGAVIGTTATTANAAAGIGFAELAGSTTGVTHQMASVTNTWQSVGDTNWSVDGNWSAGHAPVAGEEVVFDVTSSVDCTAAAGTVAQDLTSLTVTSDYTGTITFQANFAAGPSQTLTVKRDVTLNGGTLVLTGDTAGQEGVTINAEDITVGAAAVVHCDGTGFAAGQGPGAGGTGQGGAHGGRGGGGNTMLYGAVVAPVTLGSGGDDSAGGGAVKLNASDTLTVDGTIRADGAPSSLTWLSGFGFRKGHTVTGAAEAGTNYQVTLTVHYGTAADAGGDVYLDDKCRTDFEDIRFTDAGGAAELDYWMAEMVDSDHAVFWVEVSADLGSDQDIHVYYGKADASTTSSGENTFLFFDDASGTYADNWTTVQGGASYGTVGGRQAIYLSSSTTNIRTATFQYDGPMAIEADLYATALITAIQYYQDSTPATNERYHARLDVRGGEKEGILRDGAFTGSQTDVFGSTNTWISCLITRDQNADHKWYAGGALGDTRLADSTYTSGYLALNHHNSGTGGADDVRVRKFVSPEPGHGAWNAEETDPSSANDTGSGGSVYITCATLAGSGSMQARGGGAGAAANGGGGGRICMSYGTSTFTGSADASGGAGGAADGEEGSVAPGSLELAAHTAGQVGDAFTVPADYGDTALLRFRLQTDGNTDDRAFEDVQITRLVFDLTGVSGLSNLDISDVRILQDDGDGVSDGEIASSGWVVSDLSGGSGTLTVDFAPGAFVLDDDRMKNAGGKYPDIILQADVIGVAHGDGLTVTLDAADSSVTAAGTSLAIPVNAANAANAVGFAELRGTSVTATHRIVQNIWTNDDGDGDNSWSTAANWSLLRVPVAGDAITFSALYDYDCNASVGEVPQDLHSITVEAAYTSTITFDANFTEDNSQELTVAGDVVLGNGTMVLTSEIVDADSAVGATLIAENITVGQDAVLSADGRGFPAGSGPGAGEVGEGGTHGGRGGNNPDAAYGVPTAPGTCGSGGGTGAGGGAMRLIASTGTITVDGMVSASGEAEIDGGAGGSIYIDCDTFAGAGDLKAEGGAGTNGGAGGRILVKYASSSFGGTTSAAGGTGSSNSGEAGSVTPGNLAVADHTLNQVTNAFTAAGDYTDAGLYRFRLTTSGNTDSPAFEIVTVTRLEFELSGVNGIANTEITNVQVFRDVNNDGAVDGGDVEVVSSNVTISDLSGGTGTITVDFAGFSFLVNNGADGVNFMLEADVAAVAGADAVTVTLNGTDATVDATGIVLSTAVSTANASGFAALSGGTIAVTHEISNVAPVAQNDSYEVDEDNALNVAAPGVLSNDSDADPGDTLKAVKVDDPQHGTVDLADDGSFTYTPTLNYHGEDTFTYRATDSKTPSNLATVTITVNPVNDAPVATAAANPLSGDAPLTVQFTGTGTDVDLDDLSYSWDFGDGNSLDEQNPSHEYTVAGIYTATLTVSDGTLTDTDTVQITVTEPSLAPVLDSILLKDRTSGSEDYTNELTVTIEISASGPAATEMRFADTEGGLAAAAWQAYQASSEQALSAGEGMKTLWCELKNAAGSSNTASDTIVCDMTAPSVTITAPQNAAVDQAVDVTITATFNDDMISADFDAATCTVSGTLGGAYTCTPSYDAGTKTVTLSLGSVLVEEETVTVTIGGTVCDKAGNPMGADYSWSFDTTAPPNPPTLQAIVLRDRDSDSVEYSNELAVKVELTAANDPREMRFAETDAALAVAPWQTYAQTSEQTLSAGDGIRTLYCQLGNGRGESASLSDDIEVDTVAPVVLSVLPANNATDQPIDAGVCVEFIEDMAAADFTAATCTITGSISGAIATNPSYDAGTRTVAFGATAQFSYGETVTATAAAAVGDLAGNTLGTAYSWQFSITSEPGPPVIQSMTLRDRSSGDTAYSNERTVVAALVAAGGPTHMRFARTEAMLLSAPWRDYAQTSEQMLGMDEGEQRLWCELKNDYGTGSSATDTIIIDSIAPVVVSVIPSDGAFAQSVDAVIVVEFDDDMLESDFTNATVLVEGLVSGSHVTYPTYQDGMLVFNQAGSFAYGETVQCTVESSVRDKAENALGSDYTWNFPISTEDTPPVVASVTVMDRTSGSVDYTNEVDVIVNVLVSGSPWEIRVAGSEADLELAAWQSFASSFSHTLDTADGEKTVWVQARNVIGEGEPLSGTIVLDTTAPSVSSVVPPDGMTGIMPDAVIKIVMSEPMSPLLAGSVRVTGSSSGRHIITVEYDSETSEIVLHRETDFSAGEDVTCSFDMTVIDQARNVFSTSVSWSFTVLGSSPAGGGSGGGGGCFVKTASLPVSGAASAR